MNANPLLVEITVPVSAEKVWKTITEKEEMKIWYFDLEKFFPETGFEFRFLGGPEDGIQYLHICEITEVKPLKTLAYSWRYDGYPGSTIVTFEISEDTPGKTTLTLSHSGLETFPADNPDFARKNFEEGWNYLIGTSLKNYLEK